MSMKIRNLFLTALVTLIFGATSGFALIVSTIGNPLGDMIGSIVIYFIILVGLALYAYHRAKKKSVTPPVGNPIIWGLGAGIAAGITTGLEGTNIIGGGTSGMILIGCIVFIVAQVIKIDIDARKPEAERERGTKRMLLEEQTERGVHNRKVRKDMKKEEKLEEELDEDAEEIREDETEILKEVSDEDEETKKEIVNQATGVMQAEGSKDLPSVLRDISKLSKEVGNAEDVAADLEIANSMIEESIEKDNELAEHLRPISKKLKYIVNKVRGTEQNIEDNAENVHAEAEKGAEGLEKLEATKEEIAKGKEPEATKAKEQLKVIRKIRKSLEDVADKTEKITEEEKDLGSIQKKETRHEKKEEKKEVKEIKKEEKEEKKENEKEEEKGELPPPPPED